ncbi:MAG: hypothetical protein GX348_04930 [Veillonellaceae bacterium]|jgi:hypothetical protein|nr:hypothetical protein [Veillonellaceae bacterium]
MTIAQIKTKAFHLKKAGIVVIELIDDHGIEVSCLINNTKRVIGYIKAEDKIQEMLVLAANTVVSATGTQTVVCTDVYNRMFKMVNHRLEDDAIFMDVLKNDEYKIHSNAFNC